MIGAGMARAGCRVGNSPPVVEFFGNMEWFACMNDCTASFPSRRHGGALSCVMMDLDHFKQVNDTYGHIVGDMVLSSVARLITSRLRVADLFCRYGGRSSSCSCRTRA